MLLRQGQELAHAEEIVSQLHEGMSFREVSHLLPLSASNDTGVMMHGGAWYDVPMGKTCHIQLRFSHPSMGKMFWDATLNSPPSIVPIK